MGWSAGKGLGANEQGIQEPLRVSYKNDTKGTCQARKVNKKDDWVRQRKIIHFQCSRNGIQIE